MVLKSLSVVMPALNEERNLRLAATTVLNAFVQQSIDGELIIVNDGSKDGTAKVADHLALEDSRITVIHNTQPEGIGSAFWKGVKQARKKLVMIMPGDGEDNPSGAFSLLVHADQVDIVVPFIINRKVRALHRRIVSRAYSAIVNLSFGINLNYTNGAVIYNTEMLRRIKPISTGFFYQAEILVRLLRSGYLYAEVPHFLHSRETGKTKALRLSAFFNLVASYLYCLFFVRALTARMCIPVIEGTETYRRLNETVDNADAVSVNLEVP
jgi:glycosyltransferase involved in cell wall biosynthesis